MITRKSPVRVLGQSAAAVSHTGDTAEFTLATITVPANAMGASGRVDIVTRFSATNNANTKTLRIKFGGTQIVSNGVTTPVWGRQRVSVANRGATNLQDGFGDFINGLAALAAQTAPAAVDTTASVDITITGQCAVGTDTITLESYQVILYPQS